MIQVYKVKEDGAFDYTDSLVVESTEIPEGYAEDTTTDHVKTDGTRPTDSELLEQERQAKLSEMYQAYQTEKWSEITSSLLGSDNTNIVFSYAKKNKEDYQAIATAFALDTNKVDSIIGSKSHGKFYIPRADMITFASEMDKHETDMYLKMKSKESEVNAATDRTTLDSIVW